MTEISSFALINEFFLRGATERNTGETRGHMTEISSFALITSFFLRGANDRNTL